MVFAKWAARGSSTRRRQGHAGSPMGASLSRRDRNDCPAGSTGVRSDEYRMERCGSSPSSSAPKGTDETVQPAWGTCPRVRLSGVAATQCPYTGLRWAILGRIVEQDMGALFSDGGGLRKGDI